MPGVVEYTYLEILKVGDLGFPEGGNFGEIWRSAFLKGYSLCPNFMAQEIRIENLSEGEWVFIAMHPIEGRIVAHGYEDGKYRIATIFGDDATFWLQTDKFIFLKNIEG